MRESKRARERARESERARERAREREREKERERERERDEQNYQALSDHIDKSRDPTCYAASISFACPESRIANSTRETRDATRNEESGAATQHVCACACVAVTGRMFGTLKTRVSTVNNRHKAKPQRCCVGGNS